MITGAAPCGATPKGVRNAFQSHVFTRPAFQDRVKNVVGTLDAARFVPALAREGRHG